MCGAQRSCPSTGVEEAWQPSWGAGGTPELRPGPSHVTAHLDTMPIFARGPVEAAKKLEFKISELESPPLRVHSAQRDSRSHLASGSVLIKALELSWGKK